MYVELVMLSSLSVIVQNGVSPLYVASQEGHTDYGHSHQGWS